MKIKKFADFLANSYLIYDDNKAIIIDIGLLNIEPLIKFVESNNLTVCALFLTHGHFDHFYALNQLIIYYKNIKIYINKNDYELLTNPILNCSKMMMNENIIVDCENINFLSDDKTYNIFIDHPMKIIETPFHTYGSVCFYFYNDNILFSGDTLFYHSVGRYDLETSNPSLLKPSLKKLMELPDCTIVYPGHGQNTYIKDEKELFF